MVINIIMMPSKLESIKNKLILGLLRILTTNRNSENIKNMAPAIATILHHARASLTDRSGWSHF